MYKLCWWNYFYNQYQTTIHKLWVAFYLIKLCVLLVWRALFHDLSKYSNKEAIPFSEVILENSKTTYGSKQYNECLCKLKPCLEHHYRLNSHHPQHYPNGFADMSMLDRLEMIADWLASVRRHKDGDINQSVEINQQRFNYTDADKTWIKLIVSMMR